MRKRMVAKQFFINTGINITVKTNNGSYSRRRNHTRHHYAPPPKFTVFLTRWGDKRFPFLRLTNFLPSEPNNLNLDSSPKWTIFHCSSVHRICSVAKSRWTFWFFFKIKSLWHGIRATNYSLFNLRERIFLQIGFSVGSQNAQKIDVAVSKRSFKDILTIIRSSRFGSHKRPASSWLWFECLVSLKSTDYTINNIFRPSYDHSSFRIWFAFFMIENELFFFSS